VIVAFQTGIGHLWSTQSAILWLTSELSARWRVRHSVNQVLTVYSSQDA